MATTTGSWRFEGGCDCNCIRADEGDGPASEVGLTAMIDVNSGGSAGTRYYAMLTKSSISANKFWEDDPTPYMDANGNRGTSQVRFGNRIDLESIGLTAGIAWPILDHLHIGAGLRYDQLISSMHEQRMDLIKPDGATFSGASRGMPGYSADGRTYFCRPPSPLSNPNDFWLSFEPRIMWTIDAGWLSVLPHMAWRLPITRFQNGTSGRVRVLDLGISVTARF